VLEQYIRTIALALVYLLAMFGWGSLLLGLLPSWRAVSEGIASRIVAGCGALYVFFVAAGAAGFLRAPAVGMIVAAGALASCLFIRSVVKRPPDAEPWQLTDRILLLAVSVLAALQIVLGLTPLVFYDLQVYHLLAPKQFLHAGSLVHIPWNVQTNSPLAVQLIAGMSLAMDPFGQLAKLLFTIFGCLLPLGVFQLLRTAGRRAALLASLFVLCFPEFWVMQTLGVVDLGIAGFLVFGAVWLRRAILEREWRAAILAGVAFGIAIGSRYQAVVLTAWILGVVLAEDCIRRARIWPDRQALFRVVAAGVLVLLFVSPWMIRNYVHVGNPLYPLMQGVWGGSEWSADQTGRLGAEALGPRLQALPALQRVLAPVMALLVLPSNGLFGTGLLLGGLIALALPFREVRVTALLGLGGLFIWGFIRPTAGVPLLRYNAASIAFLLAATGSLLACAPFLAKAGPRIAAVLASGSFVIGMIHLHNILPAAQSLTDARLRQTLHELSVPSWAAFQYVNTHLHPAADKLLLIGETRGFWLDVPYIAPSSFNGPQLDAIFSADANTDHWKESLTGLGVTHLLISNPELQRLREHYGYLKLPSGQTETFNRWVHNLPLIFEDGRGTAVLALENTRDHSPRLQSESF
jgi:hypothetical protein